jgi:hypothetical protein
MEIVGLANLIETHTDTMVLVLSLILLASIAVFMVASSRTRRLEKRYRVLLGNAEGRDAEALLLDYIARTDSLAARLEQTRNELTDLCNVCQRHVQKVGILRYNAFDDVGGEQSFSVAFLDASATGVVISGLCGREETRIYAKPVRAGRSIHNLSDEEITAIARAIEGYSDAR